jgi:hypothetical protein
MEMNAQVGGSVSGKPALGDRALESWNRFWFSPADPTVLGLIRVCCGLITLYTALAYSLDLQEFFGPEAWWNLDSADLVRRERPNWIDPLRGTNRVMAPTPSTDFEKRYEAEYREKFGGFYPPAPFPKNDKEKKFSFDFRERYPFDFRLHNMPFPTNAEQERYLLAFAFYWNQAPAPPYPKNEAEEKAIDNYMFRFGMHPSLAYAKGKPVWSVWFHVTDPTEMVLVHSAICLVTLLFTIGFCTRITTVLTWVGQLSYIHRSTQILFGVDTMMTILLLYLMIGPSGGAYSVDRLIARWWSRSKPKIIARWRSFWGKPAGEIPPAPVPSVHPVPCVSANVAIRLLQVHVCFIYLASGLAKMLGQSWWDGTAVWGTIANYEFAPMQFEIYNNILRLLGKNQLVLYGFLTIACYFTLFFEIGYAFLIWRPATRWLMLSMAITLHGMIGLFMGLKTFSLMMLVMNMAFLRTEEVRWFFGLFSRGKKEGFASSPPSAGPVLAAAATATAVKRKK